MLIHHKLIRARNVRIDLLGDERHFCDFFDDGRVVYGTVGVFAEGEHAVALDEHARHFDRVQVVLFETFDDDEPRVLFVLPFDLLFGERARAGDIAVKIIGVRRAVERDVAPRLRPRGRKGGVRVRDAAHVRERLVKLHVRRRVARGAEFALHHFAVEVDDNHVVRGHVVIRDPAGFDDDEPAFTIDLADVAPRKEHEFVLYEVEVCLQYFLLQFFQHFGILLQSISLTACLTIGSPFTYRFANASNPATSSGSGARVTPSCPAKTLWSRYSSSVSPFSLVIT